MVGVRKMIKKNDGVVLFSVICLMSILTVILMTAIIIVSSSSKKAQGNYIDNQVYITAKSTLDTFVDCVSDYSFTDFETIRTDIKNIAINSEETFTVTLPSCLSGDCKVTVKRLSDTNVIIKAEANKNNQIATISREMLITSASVPNTTDIVFVFDCSGSMSTADRNLARNAAKAFAKELLVDNPTTSGNVRIGLAKFGTVSEQITPLTADNTIIRDDLSAYNVLSAPNPPWHNASANATNIQAGIREASAMLSHSTAVKKYIVILGDGLPTYSYRITHWGNLIGGDKYTFDNTFILGLGNNYYLYGNGYVNGRNTPAYANQIYITPDGHYVVNNKDASVGEAINARIDGYNIMTIGFGLNSLDVTQRGDAKNTLKDIADSSSYFFEADKTAESLTKT
jgi:hypothetical protein